MREIVLDTETTGLDPGAGHRIVEIGCVELLHRLPSGRQFRAYLNPERDMPEEARAIHGLTDEFLAGQPLFEAVVDEFLEFIGDAPLVIHNARFDLKFLNAELGKLGKPGIEPARAIDTVAMARQRFPGAQASLVEHEDGLVLFEGGRIVAVDDQAGLGRPIEHAPADHRRRLGHAVADPQVAPE